MTDISKEMAEFVDRILKQEALLIDRLGWPVWSCRSIEILSLIISLLFILQLFVSTDSSADSSDQRHKTDLAKTPKNKISEFRWFQLQYLVVYLIIMLADWLQGTNMYTLYSVSSSRVFALHDDVI